MTKLVLRKEIRELIESYLTDYLKEEEIEKLIKKRIREHEIKGDEKLWRSERAYP